EDLAAVVHHHVVHAAVVELLAAAPAAAGEAHLLGGQPQMVLGHGPCPALLLPARRERRLEGRDGRSHEDLPVTPAAGASWPRARYVDRARRARSRPAGTA